MGVKTLITSVNAAIGLNELRELLINKDTVLAGHSGVGKSTLINAIEPSLDLRTGAISNYTGKGRHTTTSARRYPLSSGGAVVDTPGVKMFGLWHVTRENPPRLLPRHRRPHRPTLAHSKLRAHQRFTVCTLTSMESSRY